VRRRRGGEEKKLSAKKEKLSTYLRKKGGIKQNYIKEKQKDV